MLTPLEVKRLSFYSWLYQSLKNEILYKLYHFIEHLSTKLKLWNKQSQYYFCSKNGFSLSHKFTQLMYLDSASQSTQNNVEIDHLLLQCIFIEWTLCQELGNISEQDGQDWAGWGGRSGRERTYGEANQSTGQVPTMLSTMRVINKVMRSRVWVGGWACIYQRLL